MEKNHFFKVTYGFELQLGEISNFVIREEEAKIRIISFAGERWSFTSQSLGDPVKQKPQTKPSKEKTKAPISTQPSYRKTFVDKSLRCILQANCSLAMYEIVFLVISRERESPCHMIRRATCGLHQVGENCSCNG